jgi:hypothetical protein
MLRTPGESPITKLSSSAPRSGVVQSNQPSFIQQQQHEPIIMTTATATIDHRQHQQNNRSVSQTTKQSQQSLMILQRQLQDHQSRTGSVGVLTASTPLHTQDVGVSIRLMQCLEASTYNRNDDKTKHQHNQFTKHKNPLVQKKIQQDVESRFRGSLRTTTLQTKEEDWRKRMESVKKIHEAKKAELHQRTQTHRLFKHFAFEQRMAALQQQQQQQQSASSPVNAAGDQQLISLDHREDDEMKIHHAGDSTSLFPTTNNSLTRNQVEDYFAVPSFVRPLLSTISHP